MSMLKINKYLSKIPLTVCVFLIVFLYRLPTLGFDFINNDDGWWKSRGYAFSSALSEMNWEGTAPTYHPGVTLLWSQFAAIKSYGVLQDLGYTPESTGISIYFYNHFLQNFYVVLTTSILLTILFAGLRKILGSFYSFVFIIVLISEPFFTALSRTIHLDSLLAITMFTSFVYYYLAIKSKDDTSSLETITARQKYIQRYYVTMAGIIGGLALLTKSPALFLIPFYLIPVFISRTKGIIKIYLLVMVTMFLTFFALWPAMWVAPIQTINSYVFKGVQGVGIEEGHKHFWFGEYTSNPGILFYPIILLGRYSSVLFLGSIAGAIMVLYKILKKKISVNNFYFYALLYFLGYTAMIVLVSKKMDRYSLPAIFGMISLLIYFFINLKLTRKIQSLILSVYILFTVVLYLGLHPHYLAYYSPLIGGYDYGMRIIEPQWQVAYSEVAAYFNKKEDSEKLKVALNDRFYIKEFANFETIDLDNETDRVMADYVVLPTYREDVISHYTSIINLEYEEDIRVAGVSVYKIYKVLKNGQIN